MQQPCTKASATMNSIIIASLLSVVLAQQPFAPGQDLNRRPDRGFRIESPVFLQCECNQPLAFNRCGEWRCIDLDVTRRR